MVNKILNKIAMNIAWIVSALILVLNFVFITRLDDLSEKMDMQFQNIVLLIILLINTGFIWYLLYEINKFVKNKSKKVKIITICILLLVYFAISIFWIFYMKIEPFADSEKVYNAATKLYEGDIENLKQDDYLSIYPYQSTVSCLFALIFKICHTNNFLVLEVFNAICNTISIAVLYLILRKFFKNYKINFTIYWWLSLTFIPLILLSTFVYGDYIGLMFSVLSIYCILKYNEKEKYRYCFLSAIFMALSIIAKKNYLIVMIALLIYLGLIQIKKKKNIKKYILDTLMIVIFLIISFMSQKIVIDVMCSKLEIDSSLKFPTQSFIYMAMSESYRGCGWYNEKTVTYSRYFHKDAKKYYDVLIDKRLDEFKNNPVYAFEFYTKKVASMWTNPDYQSIWYNYSLYLNPTTDKCVDYMNSNDLDFIRLNLYRGFIADIIILYQKIILISIFIGLTYTYFINRKKVDNNITLFAIILLGGFFFHIIWEAKSRYVMPYVILNIPMATIGISLLTDKVTEKYNKIRNKLNTNKKVETKLINEKNNK